MPDLTMLDILAEYYDVDVREIIDAEKNSENMNEEVKDYFCLEGNSASTTA